MIVVALLDFLGKSSEIKSITTLYEKLPKLIHNKILVAGEHGQMELFRLADNEITENLVKAAFAHSFTIGEEEGEEASKELEAHHRAGEYG